LPILWPAIALVLAVLLGGCSSGPPSKPRTFTDELHEAARRGDLARMDLLIDKGADPNQVDPDNGMTPLGDAVLAAQMESVERLLLRGADPNRRANGNTALHWAASKGDIEIARILLDHGANPTVRNREGQTPLELAHKQGETRFVFFLQEQIQTRKPVN
jgi:ankyrin repeat protein